MELARNKTCIRRLQSLDEMTKEEFDAKMERSLAQAEEGEGVDADKFFASLKTNCQKKN